VSIDRIPLPRTDGALFLCGLADVADDPAAAMAIADEATTIVCLNQIRELERRFPVYAEWVRSNKGGSVLWYPIRNFSAPSAEHVVPFLGMVVARLEAGESVLMHCAMGQGRAGTIAVCLLILLGATADDALETVARHRLFAGPGEPTQWGLVQSVAELAA
jgi:protein-tyrosine phosphatase